MPSGSYVGTPHESFEFETYDDAVAALLLSVQDGERLQVTVNGPPSTIHAFFDTTGLKQLFDQIGFRALPQHKKVRGRR